MSLFAVLTQPADAPVPQSVGNAPPQVWPHAGGVPAHVAVPLTGVGQRAHVFPHELVEVDVSGTQVPLQLWYPLGHAQAPLMQTIPPLH
jgi:hypothetical protein